VLVPPPKDNRSQEMAAALRIVRQAFIPNKVVAAPFDIVGDDSHRAGNARGSPQASHEHLIPLMRDKLAIGNQVTMYVCQNYACQAPTVGLEAINAQWNEQPMPRAKARPG